MASVVKQPGSKFWIAAFRDATGKQHRRSTGEVVKTRALAPAFHIEVSSNTTLLIVSICWGFASALVPINRSISILTYISEAGIVLCSLSKERLCSVRRRASKRGKAFPFFTLIRDDTPMLSSPV